MTTGSSTPSPAAATVAPHPALETFTDREREVFEALRDGASNAEIGALLGIGVPTVKTHVSNVMAKLGATSRTHAVALARGTAPGA